MLHAVGIIPVRYGSSRFPGKPLAPILGKPMIGWVIEGARTSRRLERIIVATDDERIARAARSLDVEAVMTSASCPSGTERVAEVARALEAEVIVNIQGDEPLVEGSMLDALVGALDDSSVLMATIIAKAADVETIGDPHVVKAVVDRNGDALYFSRSPLPSGAGDFYYQHIGIYGYRREFLLNFAALPASRLERLEKLEQLRVLESGFKIKTVEIARPTLSVDVPQDIIKVEQRLRTLVP